LKSAGSARADRAALYVVQLGAIAVVLTALPYKLFELDRFFIPKELVLHVVASTAVLLCIAHARRLPLGLVDAFLAGYLLFGVASAAAATNWWLAFRATAVSVAGVALFWVARALARAGLARALLAALTLAVVAGAITSLLQAYGVRSEYFSLNRSPGGTFGNRNFMAHLAAIGLPTLLLCALEARAPLGFLLGAIGIAIDTAALVLSRSRAAWLALIVCAVAVAWVVVRSATLRSDRRLGRRFTVLGLATGASIAAALLLPNALDWRSDSPYLDTVAGVVNYKEGSGRGRLVQYTNTLHMAEAHPLLGVGPGNWPVRYPRFAARNDPSLDREEGLTSNPWPSSDWMAILSERGFPAFLLLALALAGLMICARREMDEARRPAELLKALALAATLVVTVIVGAFDAVLLLPAPALIAWSLLGALAPAAPSRSSIALSERTRRWALIGVASVGALFAARSAMQITAMSMFSSASRLASLERASRADPGSYRIHVRLAEALARRHSCRGVRSHAGAALDLFPSAREPRRLLADCGGLAKGARSSASARAAR
jgi:O-antigen ligase